MSFWVYILATDRNGMLNTGHTDNLPKRIYDHRTELRPRSFTARYHVHKLVWAEPCPTRDEAKVREGRIK
jgi:putative endonuclease